MTTPRLQIYGDDSSFGRGLEGIKADLESQSSWRRRPWSAGNVVLGPGDRTWPLVSIDQAVQRIKDDGITSDFDGDYLTNFIETNYSEGADDYGGHFYLTDPGNFNTGERYDNCVAVWTAFNARLATEFPSARFHHYNYPRPYLYHNHANDRAAILASDHYDATLATMTAHAFSCYLWNYDDFDTQSITEGYWHDYHDAFPDLCAAMDANDGVTRPRTSFIWHRHAGPGAQRYTLCRHAQMQAWIYDRVDCEFYALWGLDADEYYWETDNAVMRPVLEAETAGMGIDLDDETERVTYLWDTAIAWALEAERRLVIAPSGLVSAEAFGTPAVAGGALPVIGPDGIVSAEAFGDASVVRAYNEVEARCLVAASQTARSRVAASQVARVLL